MSRQSPISAMIDQATAPIASRPVTCSIDSIQRSGSTRSGTTIRMASSGRM
jgi:hypothetical protein